MLLTTKSRSRKAIWPEFIIVQAIETTSSALYA